MKRVEFCFFVGYGGYGSSPSCVCVETMRNIIMQIMIHRSEYLHLHSCVRAPFPGSSVLLSHSHTRPLPRSFSPSFCLIQIRSPIAANSRTGRRREGGVLARGGLAYTYITEWGLCSRLTYLVQLE